MMRRGAYSGTGPTQDRPGLPQAEFVPTFTVVVPVYNEGDGLRAFHDRLSTAMDGVVQRVHGESWEVIYVNDGSTDASLMVLERLCEAERNCAVLNLSCNFGKEIAMTAGLDHASGAAVIVIDADLQDPPELIPELVAAWRAGWDMAYAQRRARAGETWLKRVTAQGFYRVMHQLGGVRMPRDTGDFRLMSRRVVDALLQLREQHRFMKGLFAWVGFPSIAVPYDRAPRHAGRSSFNYWKLWNFALEGITGFTVMPLKVATYLGMLTALAALVYGAIMVVRTLLYGNAVPGYPSLLVIVLFLGGLQLMTLGVIGEYLGRVFNETKQRPLYLVERFTPSRVEAAPATGRAMDMADTSADA